MTVRIILMILLLGNCAFQIGNPSTGFYPGWIAGGTFSYNGGKSSFSANGYEDTDLEGESCVRSFIGLFAIGDASVNAAASMVQIKKIRSVSQEFSNKGIIVYSVCTIVRGTK